MVACTAAERPKACTAAAARAACEEPTHAAHKFSVNADASRVQGQTSKANGRKRLFCSRLRLPVEHWTSVHLGVWAGRALIACGAEKVLDTPTSLASVSGELLPLTRRLADRFRSGVGPMRSGDPYRDTARELLERTGNHPNAQQRAKLETTAAEWLRLADKADRASALRSILNCPRVSKKNA